MVATQEAALALQQVGEHPFLYLQRQAHGDWGELDAEDKAENETSLVQGWRLLWAYMLLVVETERTWRDGDGQQQTETDRTTVQT